MEQSIHACCDKHYQQILDMPISMQGKMTPREAAKASDESRDEVICWLKGLENTEQHRARRAGDTAYDSSWMWRELGIQKPV